MGKEGLSVLLLVMHERLDAVDAGEGCGGEDGVAKDPVEVLEEFEEGDEGRAEDSHVGILGYVDHGEHHADFQHEEDPLHVDHETDQSFVGTDG